MTWGPSPTLPDVEFVREWFPEPPAPVAVQHHPYWHAYHDAALSGRLQPLVAALTGSHGQHVELAARLRPLVAALVGEHSTEGQIASALQALRFAGTNIITSDLVGSLRPMQAALVGDQAFVGSLAGSLQPLRASISAEQIITGQLTGGLQPLRASLAGSQIINSSLAARLSPLTAALTGTQSQTGTLAAALRALLFSGLGTHAQSGVLSGGLRNLSGSMAGSVRNAVVFDNSSDGGAGASATKSWTHDNHGNCFVAYIAHTANATPACTYGGVNIPRLAGPSTDGSYLGIYTSRISLFGLIDAVNLPTGPNTVAISQGATAAATGAVSFSNAGSFGAVITDTATGNISKAPAAGDGRAAVAAYIGGVNNFGAMTPNEVLRYNFIAFNTWATVMGYGLDTGSGINFAATHSFEKTGFVLPILPP